MKKFLTGGLTALSALAFPIAVHAQSTDYSFSYDSTYSLSDAEAQAAVGALGVATLLPFVCLCVYLIVDIVVAILIYKNAKKNNVDNPVLWLLLSLFFSWIGWLLYLLVGKKKTAAAQ